MRGMDKSQLEIVLGASNLKDPRNSRRGVIKRRISDYQLHDKNEDGADYDIAIIEVVEEIPFEVSTFLRLPSTLDKIEYFKVQLF